MSAKKAAKDSGADGRQGVEAWLDHVSAEQQPIVRRLDRLIFEAMPDAVCAIKFRKPSNPFGVPFYGLPGGGWVTSINSLKAQVRMIFFAGRSLEPMPPFAAPPQARGIDFRSEDDVDDKQLKSWLRQAKKLPGWGRL